MIADAAAAAGAGAGGGPAEGTTARDRARAAREQSHAERALLELVKDLVGSFLTDSFGLPSFARVLRVFVRTGFPAIARRVVWKELGDVGLLHLLDSPSAAVAAAAAATAPSSTCFSAPGGCDGGNENGGSGGGGRRGGSGGDDDDAYLYPTDVEGAIVEAYLAALEHPRFGLISAGVTVVAAAAAATEAGAAATREVVRGDQEQLSSAAAGVSMREVAVHHLACYLFSPPPPRSPPLASTDAATPSPRKDTKEIEGEPPLRPDFGRRKMFERLLLQHREQLGEGRGAAGSVVAAVLGHDCRGSAAGDVASTGDNGGGGGGAREVCAWNSKLGARRRELLRAYCRVGGGQGGDSIASDVAGDHGAEDGSSGGGGDGIVAWLDKETDVIGTAERLARAMFYG